MTEIWNFIFPFIEKTSLGDIVVLILLLFIKFNDLRHIELHNELEDSKSVKKGEMTFQEYQYAHHGKTLRQIT
jgi:hypothetical protein